MATKGLILSTLALYKVLNEKLFSWDKDKLDITYDDLSMNSYPDFLVNFATTIKREEDGALFKVLCSARFTDRFGAGLSSQYVSVHCHDARSGSVGEDGKVVIVPIPGIQSFTEFTCSEDGAELPVLVV